MPIPVVIANLLLPVLEVAVVSLVSGLARRVGDHLFGEDNSHDSKALIEQVKSDSRYIQAQLEYLMRKSAREEELKIIAAIQAEKRLQLQAQELQDRRELSALQRELMREFQKQAIQMKLTEIQTLWDKDTWFSNLSRQETEQILW